VKAKTKKHGSASGAIVRTRGSTTTREARVRGVRQARHAARSIVTDLLELTAEVASHTNLQGASARI
jgi:hypothetical protein